MNFSTSARDLLELAQRLAAALVLKDGVRKLERVADAVGVHRAPRRWVMTLTK